MNEHFIPPRKASSLIPQRYENDGAARIFLLQPSRQGGMMINEAFLAITRSKS